MLKQVITLCSTIICLTNGYRAGAPNTACDTLLPLHGSTAQNKLTPPVVSPYYIFVNGGANIANGGKVSVTLGGSRPFKGFVIIGEHIDINGKRHRMGTWESSDPKVKLACGDGSGLTHNDASDKSNITVEFTTPPAPFKGWINFWGSFVEDKQTYWVILYSQIQVYVAPYSTTSISITGSGGDLSTSNAGVRTELRPNNPKTARTGSGSSYMTTEPYKTTTVARTTMEEYTSASTTTMKPPANVKTIGAGKDNQHHNAFGDPPHGQHLAKGKTGKAQEQNSGCDMVKISLTSLVIAWLHLLL